MKTCICTAGNYSPGCPVPSHQATAESIARRASRARDLVEIMSLFTKPAVVDRRPIPKKNITVVTHFLESDEDCSSDYVSVEVFINGKPVASYGDSYHEKGKENAEGFIAGLIYAYGQENCAVDQVNKADIQE